MIIGGIVKLYDTAVWSLRDVVRDIELVFTFGRILAQKKTV